MIQCGPVAHLAKILVVICNSLTAVILAGTSDHIDRDTHRLAGERVIKRIEDFDHSCGGGSRVAVEIREVGPLIQLSLPYNPGDKGNLVYLDPAAESIARSLPSIDQPCGVEMVNECLTWDSASFADGSYFDLTLPSI